MDKLERVLMWLSRLPEPEKLTVRFDESHQLIVVCSDYRSATRLWNLRHHLLPEISRLKVFVDSDYYASYPVQ